MGEVIMNTPEKNVAPKEKGAQKIKVYKRSLKDALIANDYHYANTNSILYNAMGTQRRAESFFNSTTLNPQDDWKFIDSFSKLDANGLVDKAGKVNSAKLIKQTALLKKFYNSANKLLQQSLNGSNKASEGKKLISSEFLNDDGDGMVDVFARAGGYLMAVENGAAKEDAKFIKGYAKWVEQTIADLHNNFDGALSEVVKTTFDANAAVLKRQKQEHGKTKGSAKQPEKEQTKDVKSTALITKEMADDINRIRTIGVGDLKRKGVKKGMSDNISDNIKVEDVVNGDPKEAPITEAKDSMLVETEGKTPATPATKESKKKKGNGIGWKIATGALAATTIAAGIVHGVEANARKNLQNENNELSWNNQVLQGKLDSAEYQYGILAGAYENVYHSYNELLKSYNKLYEESQGQGEEIVRLRGELDILTIECQNKNTEIKRLEGVITRLQEELRIAQQNGSDTSDLLGQLSEAQHQLGETQKELAAALTRARTAEQKYEDMLKNYADVQAILDEYGVSSVRELVNKLEAEKSALEDEVDKYKTLYEQLKQSGASDAELIAAQEKISELEKQLTAANKENSRLQGIIENLKVEIIDLNKRITELEANQSAGNTQTGTQENGNGSSQMGTGNNTQNNEDQHVNNTGADDDLTKYEIDDGQGKDF